MEGSAQGRLDVAADVIQTVPVRGLLGYVPQEATSLSRPFIRCEVIAHPKAPSDLDISDEELEEIVAAADWFGTTHESLIKALTRKLKQVRGGKDSWPLK